MRSILLVLVVGLSLLAVDATADTRKLQMEMEKLVHDLDAEKAQQTAYLRMVEVRGVRTVATEVSGEIKNVGARVLSSVKLVVLSLDKTGKPIHETELLVVGPAAREGGLLKANYSRKFSVKIEPPSEWAGQVEVRVVTVAFAPSATQ